MEAQVISLTSGIIATWALRIVINFYHLDPSLTYENALDLLDILGPPICIYASSDQSTLDTIEVTVVVWNTVLTSQRP